MVAQEFTAILTEPKISLEASVELVASSSQDNIINNDDIANSGMCSVTLGPLRTYTYTNILS